MVKQQLRDCHLSQKLTHIKYLSANYTYAHRLRLEGEIMTTTIFMWVVIVLLVVILIWLYLLGGYLIAIKRRILHVIEKLDELR